MKGELKYFDTAATGALADTTGAISVLNAMQQGTDANTRVGKQIYMKSVHLQGTINSRTSSTSPSFVRIMLVWDAQPNNTLAAVTDILSTSTSLSELNLNNRERFTVLRDLKYNSPDRAGGGDQGKVIDMFVNLGNKKTTFSGIIAGITNVATGALLLCIIGENTAVSNYAPYVITNARVRYYDN